MPDATTLESAVCDARKALIDSFSESFPDFFVTEKDKECIDQFIENYLLNWDQRQVISAYTESLMKNEVNHLRTL